MLNLETILQNDPLNPSVALRHANAKAIYDSILEDENERLRFRARVNIYEKGEKSTAYFFRQIKLNAARSNVSTLNVRGNMVEDNEEVNKALFNFYKNLYKEECEVSQRIASDKCNEFLDKTLPKISLAQSQECDRRISKEEVRNILFHGLNRKKSPGNDGLTVGLLQVLWELLEPYFMDCIHEAIEKGELSNSQRQGIVKLIEKKGTDRRHIENWRPISLLNVDTKIYSKILATRIKVVLPSIISEEQTAFISGRYIGEGTQLIQGIIDHFENTDNAGMLVAIDFRKAFDSINHKYLLKTLSQFGFGKHFIQMVMTLFNGAENAILNHGATTRYFKLERSCRQGDCLSPYLFILAMETLCHKIKQCKKIRGVKVDNATYKYSAYADDLTAFVRDRESLNELIKILNNFRKISGLEINLGKTEGLILGKNSNAFESAGIKIVTEIKITGINFGYDRDRVDDLNFNPILMKMARRFNDWRGRNLSVLGKVLVSKAQGMSQLTFAASLTMVPDWVIKQATTLIYKFIWGGPDKITRELACKDYEEGGLRAPNIRLLIDALHGTWIVRYCKAGFHGWKNFMNAELRKLNCDKSCLTGNFQPNQNKKHSKLNVLSHAIYVWSQVTSGADKMDINQILESSIWMNGDITSRTHLPLKYNMRSNNCHKIKDLLNTNNKLSTFEELTNKGWHPGDYISWISIMSCIPKAWKKQIEHHANLSVEATTLAVNHPLVVDNESTHTSINGPDSISGSAIMPAVCRPLNAIEASIEHMEFLFHDSKAIPIKKIKCYNKNFSFYLHYYFFRLEPLNYIIRSNFIYAKTCINYFNHFLLYLCLCSRTI